MIKTIDLKKTILEDNDSDADLLRKQLEGKGCFYINVMSSPGSGKTSCIIEIIKKLKALRPDARIGVMEADIDSDVDAVTVAERAGVEAVQLHTGGMCHLDAEMSRQGMRLLEEAGAAFDIVILENVGNLVCPAEFDTGAHMNICILAVPEGDDKPLKYHLIFSKSDIVLVNKIDALPVFDFDMEKVKQNISFRNEKLTVFPVSAKNAEGFDEVAEAITGRIFKKN